MHAHTLVQASRISIVATVLGEMEFEYLNFLPGSAVLSAPNDFYWATRDEIAKGLDKVYGLESLNGLFEKLGKRQSPDGVVQYVVSKKHREQIDEWFRQAMH